jgi:hypothetical protein
MQTELDPKYAAKFDIMNCKIHRDPSVEGVWAVDNPAKHLRLVIYMAGYRDPFGKVRTMNDFEEGGLTEGKTHKQNDDEDTLDKKQKDQQRKGAAKNKRQVTESFGAGTFFKSAGSSELKFCKRINESRALIAHADGTETWVDVADLNIDPATVRSVTLK